MNTVTTDASDAALLLAFRGGQLDAFTSLYDRYGDRLFFYVRTLTGSAEVAEDVVQEAYVRLLRVEPSGPDVPLAPFLFTAARNLAVDAQRREGVRGMVEASASAPGPAAESNSEFGELLDTLPAEQREVVFLKIHTGLTFAEIAEVTGLKLSTVASRYRYALEKLSGVLTAEGVSR
jgi:RNA polymerase sigma-70 factor (ECF subfamily)